MTFTIPRKLLAAELALLQAVSERKATIPVLSTVMVGLVGETLTLTATDLDATLQTEIPAQGDAWGGCVPSKPLYDLVRLLDTDEIRCTPKPNQRLEISADKSRHLLPVIPIAEFPEIERPDGDGFVLPLESLISAIKATSFTMLDPRATVKADDLKYTGLSLRKVGNQLEVMATRKFVTAVAEMEAEAPDFSVILPAQAVDVLTKMDGEIVQLRYNESLVELTAGHRSIIARQLMGAFPKWRDFLPKYEYQLTVDSAALTNAIKRASVTNGTDNAVGYESLKVTFAKDALTVETRDDSHGHSQEPVAVVSNLNGDSVSLGIVGEQMLGVLAQCEGEVQCSLGPNAPLLIKQPARSYIVMPVRLKW